jgi:dolichol-phosphate mannosyltransferase
MKKAIIVLPTYNESKNIQQLIKDIFSVARTISNWQIELLVVDSNSPDQTADIVKKLQSEYPLLHLLETPKEGLGKAYSRGFTEAIDNLQAYVIFEMDADLSHDPKKIPEFLQKIEKGADFVIGSRYIKGGSIPKDWGLHRKIFSVLGNLIVRFGFMKLRISDWTSGYRAIKVWIIKKNLGIISTYSGYVFQVALLDNAVKNGAKIQEVPINFVDRKEGVSKINSIQYIIQTLLYVFTHSDFIKFVIVGLIGFGVDFGFAYFFIHGIHLSKPISNAISAEFAIISNFLLNNFWSFKHKKIDGGIIEYFKKLLFFNIVSSGSIIIQGTGMDIALRLFGDTTWNIMNILHIESWIVYKVGIIAFIIIPYSYILYNKVIWKDK